MGSDGTCSRCGAPLRWVKTSNGKNQPLNPEPSSDPDRGNVRLDDDGISHYVHDDQREGLREKGVPIYEAHFASCTGVSGDA